MKTTKLISLLTAVMVVGFGGLIAGSGTNTLAADVIKGWWTDYDGKRYHCPPDCGRRPVYRPTPGPTPEERERAWEQQDLREAADDANDTGIEYYERGDWYNAIRYFKEALEYTPDDDDILDNLRSAEQHAREAGESRRKAEEARKLKVSEQLKSVEHHSKTAAGLSGLSSKKEVGRGFDTAGEYKGALDAVVVDGRGYDPGKEPVVPEGKRTKTIEKLEKQRDEVKKKIKELEEKVAKLAEKAEKTPKETVEFVKFKQELSTNKDKKNFLDFSINEELQKPTTSDDPKKEKTGETVPVPGK